MADYTLLINGLDMTTGLRSESMTLKLNTFDFTLNDPNALGIGATVPLSVSFTWPGMGVAWTGTLVWAQAIAATAVGGTAYLVASATNSAAPVSGTAPFGLNSTPSDTTTLFELEDGSGHILLESAGTGFGSYLTEGAHSFSFRELSVTQRQNTDLSTSVIVECTVFQPGLWPGMTVTMQAYMGTWQVISSQTYTVRMVVVTWPGDRPTYRVTLGDPLVSQALSGVG